MKMHELLSTPDKWTQGTQARNAKGDRVPLAAKDAVCWCITGAMFKCYSSLDEILWSNIIEKIGKKLHLSRVFDGIAAIQRWNDATERTHAEVLALLKSLDI